jgi:hypothetical protein
MLNGSSYLLQKNKEFLLKIGAYREQCLVTMADHKCAKERVEGLHDRSRDDL